MVVEFNGKRIALPSRRLDRVQATEAEPTTARTGHTTRQEQETPAREALRFFRRGQAYQLDNRERPKKKLDKLKWYRPQWKPHRILYRPIGDRLK